MGAEPSFTALRIFSLLLQSTVRQNSGYSLAKNLGISPDHSYHMLARLEAGGFLDSEWENADTAILGRPRRRFYSLTPEGKTFATAKLRLIQVSSL